MLFSADAGDLGRELYSFPLAWIGDETVDSFGYGCPGTAGVVPTLDVEGEADASSLFAFRLVVEDGRPSSPTFLLFSRVSAATPIAGCTLWIGGNVLLGLGSTDVTGRSVFPFLPNAGLAGQRFVSQAFVLDPGGAAWGIASATAALELVIGP